MDSVLNELANIGLGCHMGGMFAEAFGNADDLKLLTPSIWITASNRLHM